MAMTTQHKSVALPLALAYAALIVYASLYPFADWRDQGIAPWAYLAALYSLFPAIWNDVAQLTRRVLPERFTSINALIPRRTVEGASS